jgi:putative cofactor-binding repeat protein
MMSWANFKDFGVIVNNQDGTILTADEQNQGTAVSFGVAVSDDNSVTRVEADDATAVATISGNYHSEHGMTGLTLTVPVEGAVTIQVGQCTYSGSDIVVKNAAGETVVTKSPTQACWKNDHSNVTEVYYTGEATTLTVSGMSYCAYVGVYANETPIIKYDIAFGMGSETAEGTLPTGTTWTQGDSYTLPTNFTLYKEGYTLTGWNDGTRTVGVGEAYTPVSDVTLTPVFTKNVKNLSERNDAATVKWDFQRKNGAPTLAAQGSNNGTGIYVAQTSVDGNTIDVKLDYDATSGKIANANWTDWAQMNAGTKFTIPSAKGAVVSIEAYSAPTTTTIDGQTDYTANGNTISYTVGSSAENIDIVIGDGSYYRYIQVVLPIIPVSAAGKTYNDEAAKVVFAMSDQNAPDVYTAEPADGFSTVAFDYGDCEITGTVSITDVNNSKVGITGIKFRPSGSTQSLTWLVRPAAGLTFTPTHLVGYINRCGTDAENGVKVSARLGDGSEVALGTYTALRQGKDATQKYASSAVYQYDITLTAAQQTQLAGADGFYLIATVGVASNKEGAFGEVTVEGTLNGTAANVNKYTVDLVAAPEEGGSVSIYPKSDEYLENDEVTLTATENFGYDFVSWTNAEGDTVSTAAKFKYTVTADATLTANFKKVNTYALDITVEGGANDYMVSLSPAATIVDGKSMYEEGTKVTITASSNKILTFTDWSNGETASEMAINMNEDKAFTANYSAIDYIVGWDFYQKGSDGRAADFAAADNDAVTLVMRDTDGNTASWLDKSQVAAGGYEGRPAAVNWKTGSKNGDVGHYYWQTCVNAAAFSDIKVITSMVYNYNAYTKQLVEYSLDGESWTTAGTITLEGAKKWADETFALPAAVNNQEKLYLRWISDTSSDIDGTSSANDGITLGATFIVGTAKLVDDGTAPALVSTVPAQGATGASANGKVVLTFDEKVQLTANAKATLGDLTLESAVSGKTIICEYKGLVYGTEYTFTLAGGSVSDLTDNVLNDDIQITFTTKEKPAVEKALYDFIVPTDGTISEALAAANARGTSASDRFRIFILDGSYTFDTNGTTTGGDGNTYDDPRSYLTAPYVSFIGQSKDGVVITNITPEATWDNGYGAACPLEGIGKGDVLIIQSTGHDAYFQNLTMKSSMGDGHGRDIVLNDQSNRTVFKDACLWAYQDTYVSNNQSGKFYFEGGVLRGRTDYLCGKGDVYYNEVTLQQCGTGGYLAVPSTAKKYGYVFQGCYIKKESKDVTFYLGRPWGSGTPTASFINTKMDANALGNGWADMSGGWPQRFAEYNSYLTSGTSIDLSTRRTSWTGKDGAEHANDPILTLDDVQAMSLTNVMGQDDDWDPTALTEQASAPANVTVNSATGELSWDNNNYVLLWAIFKDGKFVATTIEPTYTVDDATATWTVRAANEMGGLGEATTATVVADNATGIIEVKQEAISDDALYNLAGQKVNANYKGIIIKKGVKIVK